jgi:glutathione S-transferase
VHVILAEYRKLSPLQLVPAIEVEGNILADSIAILEVNSSL